MEIHTTNLEATQDGVCRQAIEKTADILSRHTQYRVEVQESAPVDDDGIEIVNGGLAPIRVVWRRAEASSWPEGLAAASGQPIVVDDIEEADGHGPVYRIPAQITHWEHTLTELARNPDLARAVMEDEAWPKTTRPVDPVRD